jgi:hypothetical protein
MVLAMVRWGGWTLWVVTKRHYTELNFKGDYLAPVHSGKMVLMVAR